MKSAHLCNRLLWEGHKSQGRRGGLPY